MDTQGLAVDDDDGGGWLYDDGDHVGSMMIRFVMLFNMMILRPQPVQFHRPSLLFVCLS